MNDKYNGIDIRLERDPRYAAAKLRLGELQLELNTLQHERERVERGLGSLMIDVGANRKREAEALLVGGESHGAAYQQRETLTKTLNEARHKIAVLYEAIEMQKRIVAELASEVSSVIARELAPHHRANVVEVFNALLQLNTALEAEADLRDSLYEHGVMYSGSIRPMVFTGTLKDGNSRIMHYMKECYEHGFVERQHLPDVVLDRIPKRESVPTPAAKPAAASRRDPAEWTPA